MYSPAHASSMIIQVGEHENGQQQTGLANVWHDKRANSALADAIQAYQQNQFSELKTAGSTGLKSGTFWSQFRLANSSDEPLTVHLEYVDHQVIGLGAYASSQGADDYVQIADLDVTKPFSHRPITHNRLVFAVTLAPLQTKQVLVEFRSDKMGFVFPSLRIWSPANLQASLTKETSSVTFLLGGFFLMAVLALVAGVVAQEKTYYIYSVYAFSKITTWATVFGYTHQYLLQDNFHWRLTWLSSAVTIASGICFARVFLRTQANTPRLDKLIQFTLANAAFLFVCALCDFTVCAIISITIALLMYPCMALVAAIRWRQGSTEALVFMLGWALLIVSLVMQALRDLGWVAPSLFNYYLPAFASFCEMLTIMAAMLIKLRKLLLEKRKTERKYLYHLHSSKSELEKQVQLRTQELQAAKQKAEKEAYTDALTGIDNRRCFFAKANTRIALARRKQHKLCLMMLDIDHFKLINDKHGHDAGDVALVAFSQAVTSTIRSTDIFARIGGEEFVILSDEPFEGAVELAERLCSRISQLKLPTVNGKITFTVSIGIAQYYDDEPLEVLLKRADERLYAAKKAGRNCVMAMSA